MKDEAKTAIDYASGGITIGAFFEALPEITALVALIWWLIRIWELQTIQNLIAKFRK